MRITPLDVRKQEFRKAVRGFDCDEVRAFLATLADEYETVLVDNKQIRDQVMEQDDKIAEYKTMERTLRDTLMTAEKLMQETRETANKEGDIIVQSAHQKAKSILEECRLRTEELRREIVGLRKEKETYLARFKGLAEAQISFIETHRNDFADLDKRLVDMMDSVVDGTINSEAEAKFSSSAPVAHSPSPVVPEADNSYQAVPETPAAPVKQEVDMWRDYNPGTDSEQPSVAEQPSVDATQEIAAYSGPEDPQNAQTPAAPVEGPSPAMVDMAAMGIPVPAVPVAGQTEVEKEYDAINEAVSATFVENPQP